MATWTGHIVIIPDDIPAKTCERARKAAASLYPEYRALHAQLERHPEKGLYPASRDALKKLYPDIDVEGFIDGGGRMPMSPEKMIEAFTTFKSYAVGYREYPADKSKWIVCVGSDDGDPPRSDLYWAIEAALSYGVLGVLGIK